MKILLNNNRSKKSTGYSNLLTVNLTGREKKLPVGEIRPTINEQDVYNQERESSNKIRLVCDINPICTNVLFNNITEIVKNEGSNDCKCLNYTSLGSSASNINDDSDFSHVQGKPKQFFRTNGAFEAIRDTQLSNLQNGFQYHCGTNIFNNHYLRSKTFKTVCLPKTATNVFNTIADYARDINGDWIKSYSDYMEGTKEPDIKLHLYLNEEIDSFKDCVNSKLIDNNGWLGFTNIGKMTTYDEENNPYDFSKVINSEKSCNFIDMYPTRELFYVTPIYNKHRHRIEKNWNYCLTYPSGTCTEVPFIRPVTNSLKVCAYDDYSMNVNGTKGIKIFSISKHGLLEGDIVNIYQNDEVVIRDAKVVSVINDYDFLIFNNGNQLSTAYIEVSTVTRLGDETITVNYSNGWKIDFTSHDNLYLKIDKIHLNPLEIMSGDDRKRYMAMRFPYIPGTNKVNVDVNSLDVSFKKVVGANELDYYVQIVSKLPNWKHANFKLTEDMATNGNYIKEYGKKEYEFENHINKLAYARTIYNDEVSEIVFTDDVDIAMLRDNLNRPISSINLTLLKNNQGYKEWYGKNGQEINITSDLVEYSHCFGKLNCAFELSPHSLYMDNMPNALSLHNCSEPNLGLSMKLINTDRPSALDEDEIQYNPTQDYVGDTKFYGNLCAYSKDTLDEVTIQNIKYRFNTAQRELVQGSELIKGDKSYDAFEKLRYDEIQTDDYDFTSKPSSPVFSLMNGAKTTSRKVCQRKEGYLYTPHYSIPIKSFSDEITTSTPIYNKIKDVLFNNDLYTLYLAHKLDTFKGKTLIIRYPIKKGFIFINFKVEEVINDKKITCSLIGVKKNYPILDNEVRISNEDIDRDELKKSVIIVPDINVPNYAHLSMDGSAYFMWRPLIQNGFERGSSKNETYPFLNGALYIQKKINLFVQRQDPKEYAKLLPLEFPFDVKPRPIKIENKDNYYQERDIKC